MHCIVLLLRSTCLTSRREASIVAPKSLLLEEKVAQLKAVTDEVEGSPLKKGSWLS